MKNFRSPQRPKKSSLIAGAAAIIDALQQGKALDKIYVDAKLVSAELSVLRKLATELAVPLNYVPPQKLNSFNVEGHGGCIAQIAKVQYQNLQDIISFVVEQGQTPLFLILDGITDIRNIGGIARTAWCCGVNAIIIPDKGVGALNEDAILTSAGALEKIPVCRVNSLMKAVDELHMNGITVFASEMTASKNIADCDFSIPAAIIMGSEEKGVYPALLKICDERISIPMKNNFESLNVSVATGMILYEVMKQRGGNE
ncbi:23S rRNA (guanosine(2251)-2'-O)-methyltransferase RlmB [Niabella yanshanensis]|uniref:23S rRNA (Guanosine(2251)-2'-O)-methyltransferase RlmB n=1 Tax=Niabella yanshanensis TaxID=577386 RepID=A0ABZ0WBT9_9BACT|nr:23S rRNA (guanosine(2251)-2'-O)-methyltransferase RlmB [Niabella yanshanensis]WQD40002.1 23S rRNA (guanosine(2251)-2'-O)-methyltransferase RlmB [Niabella yanshanensis]